MKPQPLTTESALLALCVSVLWGGNVVAIKYGLATFPPLWSAFWRFVVGVLAVLAWARLSRAAIWPERGDWRGLLPLGGMFALQICVLNAGISSTSPAYAVVLLNSHPVFTNLFGHFFESEDKLNTRRLLGLALALGGIVFVAAGRPDESLAPRPWLGNSLMLISAAALALRVIYTRRLVQRMPPVRPVIWQILFGLPVFVALAAIFEPPLLQPLAWEPVLAILYQGPVIAGFCFVIWTTLLRKHAASTISMFGFTVPFFGVFLSAWMFDERIPIHLLLGAFLVTVGILVVTRQPSKKPPKVEAVEVKGAAS